MSSYVISYLCDDLNISKHFRVRYGSNKFCNARFIDLFRIP